MCDLIISAKRIQRYIQGNQWIKRKALRKNTWWMSMISEHVFKSNVLRSVFTFAKLFLVSFLPHPNVKMLQERGNTKACWQFDHKTPRVKVKDWNNLLNLFNTQCLFTCLRAVNWKHITAHSSKWKTKQRQWWRIYVWSIEHHQCKTKCI